MIYEIGRHGLQCSGHGYGYCYREPHMTQDEIQFPGLGRTEIRKRKNAILLDGIINKTGRRSGQKAKRFGRG